MLRPRSLQTRRWHVGAEPRVGANTPSSRGRSPRRLGVPLAIGCQAQREVRLTLDYACVCVTDSVTCQIPFRWLGGIFSKMHPRGGTAAGEAARENHVKRPKPHWKAYVRPDRGCGTAPLAPDTGDRAATFPLSWSGLTPDTFLSPRDTSSRSWVSWAGSLGLVPGPSPV